MILLHKHLHFVWIGRKLERKKMGERKWRRKGLFFFPIWIVEENGKERKKWWVLWEFFSPHP